jgi:hypothetical protein
LGASLLQSYHLSFTFAEDDDNNKILSSLSLLRNRKSSSFSDDCGYPSSKVSQLFSPSFVHE